VRGFISGAFVAGEPVERDGLAVIPIRRRSTGETIDASLIAHHDWARRGPSTMRAWIPTV
jgi:hypothetical protein